MGGGDGVVVYSSAAKGGEVGASAEGLADVFGEGADVGAGAAVDADGEFGVVIFEDVYAVDFDLS